MDKKEIFIQAIENMKKVRIIVNSEEKGVINRTCIPFDYGISRRYKDGRERYHFYDLDSPEGSHNLSILPSQLLEIELTDETFNPGDYITWNTNWILPRDWGDFS